MEPRVRPYESRDEEAYQRVIALTYRDGIVPPPEERKWRYTRGYVLDTGGEPDAVFSALDLTATRGRALLKCAGVAGVAVSPERRRGGLGERLMVGAVRQFREEGIPLASLYAFREPFYRKVGYEVCGKRLEIVCPTHRLPIAESDLPIRRLTPADYAEIAPCYEAWAHARSGMNVRSPLMWERFLNESHPNTVYAAGDPVEGYVAIRHQVAFWERQSLTEVAWSTPRGYTACLELMRQIGINKTQLSWFEPSDSPFLASHMDQGVSVSVARPIMFRVNDVPGALRQLQTEETGEFVFAVTDSIVPENQGPWQVRFSPAGVEVELGGVPDFTLDIRPFAQAFLGDPSLQDLARIGKVQVTRAQGLAEAARLLSPLPVYCGDFF